MPPTKIGDDEESGRYTPTANASDGMPASSSTTEIMTPNSTRPHLGDRYVHRGGLVKLHEDRPQQHGREHRADDDRHLLMARRGADEVAGLQVLRRGAAVRRRDADDAAHRERGHVPARPHPAH